LKERTQMQARYQRLQKALKITNGGHGRTKKLKALEALQEKEQNFAKTYNHNISHQIVKFAVDNKASVIKLELLEGIAREEKNRFLLRNWSYYQLQTMIQYKAQKYGIEVMFIDPYHTSQTCAVCGHYEPNQRLEQAIFVCKNEQCKQVGVQTNADYNGALNIAKSKQFVTTKEECQYYMLSQKKKDTPSVSASIEGINKD
jgi:putative transposase